MTANQIWWIAAILFFVWMMWRGGCGMAMRRGRRRGGHAEHGEMGTATDPVCRMSVDPAKSAGTRVREGETYFFCSQACLDAFDASPAMFSQRRETQQHRHHGC